MVPMFSRIEGSLRAYQWGKPGGIAEMLGREVGEPGTPEAEYWFTTDALLLKVLAAAETLSLQVHPGPELAAEGFAREEAAGVPHDAPHRSYKDAAAKTELILALSDRFEALSGFRVAEAAARDIARLVDAAGPVAGDLAPPLMTLLAEDATVGEAFLLVISDEGRPLVEALLPALDSHAAEFPVQARLAGLYPGDAGVVASLLLNHVVLRRGEVLAARTGDIHAYLSGTGIELMVRSDNVLRGGLTPKHVDLPELRKALNVPAGEPNIVAPTALGDAALEFAVPAVPADIRLVVVRGDAQIPLARDAIALCIRGAFTLQADGDEMRLERGDAARIAAAGCVAVAGEGELYVAR